jgi:hypothetical protein
MQNKILLLVILVFAAFTIGNAFATTSPFWGDLKPGQFGVGFQIIEKYDYSRPFKRKFDYEGNMVSGERARPLQINVWYPAKSKSNSSMLLADYIHLAATEDLSKLTDDAKEQSEKRFLQSRWFQGVPEEKIKELLTKPAAAVRKADHADGRFPLIVIANSGSLSSPSGQFVLAEYLASHGYIVASVPSRGAQSPGLGGRESIVQLQDLQFVIGSLHDFPSLDRDKLAAIGFGLGGLSTALLAMHNTDLDAMVSLDSVLANRFGYSLIFQSSLYKPNQLTLPVLHITSQTTNEDTDYAFFKATKFSPAYYVKLKGLTAPDFSSIGMLKSMLPLPAPKEGELPNTKLGHETFAQYIHHFLHANLHKNAESKAFLENTAAPAEFVVVERKDAIPAPPTEAQFVQIIREKGAQKAAEIQKEYARLAAEYRIYDPDVLFPIAQEYAQAKKTNEAIAVLNICTEAFPDYWECYDHIGRIHMDSGNKQLAIENLSRSMDLNPDNTETAEILQKLKES